MLRREILFGFDSTRSFMALSIPGGWSEMDQNKAGALQCLKHFSENFGFSICSADLVRDISRYSWKAKFVNAYKNVKSLSAATKLHRRWVLEDKREREVDFAHVHLDETDPSIGYYIYMELKPEEDSDDDDDYDEDSPKPRKRKDDGYLQEETGKLIMRKFDVASGEFDPDRETGIVEISTRAFTAETSVYSRDQWVVWPEQLNSSRQSSVLAIFNIQTRQVRRLSQRNYCQGSFALSPDGKTIFVELRRLWSNGTSHGLAAIDVEQDKILWTNSSLLHCNILAASDYHIIINHNRDFDDNANTITTVKTSDGSTNSSTRITDVVPGARWPTHAFFLSDNRCVVMWLRFLTVIDLHDGKLLCKVSYAKNDKDKSYYNAKCATMHSGLLFVNMGDYTHATGIVSVYDTTSHRDSLIRLRSANKVFEAPSIAIASDLSMILASTSIGGSALCIKLE